MPANYTELVDDIVNLIGKSGYRTKCPVWIGFAEKEAVREIRELREVIYKTVGATMTADDNEITMPAGITGVEGMQIDTSPIRMMRQVKISELQHQRQVMSLASDLYPTIFAWTAAEKIEMAPIPTLANAYTLYYKGAMVEVENTKVTSQILEQAPEFLYYRAAAHGFLYARNFETADQYKAEAMGALKTYAQLLARGDTDTPQVAPFSYVHDHPQITGSY